MAAEVGQRVPPYPAEAVMLNAPAQGPSGLGKGLFVEAEKGQRRGQSKVRIDGV